MQVITITTYIAHSDCCCLIRVIFEFYAYLEVSYLRIMKSITLIIIKD